MAKRSLRTRPLTGSMALDFTEIPEAHKRSVGARVSDSFEFFAESFLRAFGYKIVEGPGRGADGGRDLVVAEVGGLSGIETRWLVSCKHKAHSGNAVNSKDEENLENRVRKAKCRGFLWFYSTTPTEDLKRDFAALEDDGYPVTGFSHGIIEEHLLDERRPAMTTLAKQYFPKSFKAWRDSSAPINACLTLDDLKALVVLRNRYPSHEALLKRALLERDVHLRVAPWVWTEVFPLAANPKTERLYDGIKDVVVYYGITALDAPLTLMAQDLYNVAPNPRPSFDSYIRDIENANLDRFLAHLERHLAKTRSKKSTVQAIGDVLGLKDNEIRNLERAASGGTLLPVLRRFLEALQPSEQLVAQLLIDDQLTENQKQQRVQASLSFNSVPNAVRKHQGPVTVKYVPPTTLDERVFGLLNGMASEWVGLPIDMFQTKASEVRTKFPHIRSMLGYLFGEGRGFRPLKKLIEKTDLDLTKVIFYLIYAPDCQYLSVSGHTLAGRLKHGLSAITNVGDRKTFWGPVLKPNGPKEDSDLDALVEALEVCYRS